MPNESSQSVPVNGETRPVVVQVVTTVDSIDAAERITEELLMKRLAACVQRSGPITSRYWWNGEIATAAEWTLTCKTTRERKEALVAAIRYRHPYEVPELLITKARSDKPYAAWVAEQVS